MNLPDPKQLATDFAEVWEKKYGNTATPELLVAWEDLFQIFNDIINKNMQLTTNQTVKKYVMPLPTGTGKSQATRHYLHSLDKSVGVLYVGYFKDDLNSAEVDINANIFGYPEETNRYPVATDARAYHSDVRYSTEELATIPCLLITHERYLRSANQNKLSELMTFNGGQRQLIIVDEAISQIDDYQINLSDITTLIAKLNTIVNNIKGTGFEADLTTLEEELKYLEFIKELIENQQDQITSQSGVMVDEIQTKSIQKPTNGIKTLSSYIKISDKKAFVKQIDVATDFQRLTDIVLKVTMIQKSKHLYYAKIKGKLNICGTSWIDIQNKNSVILDATANINTIYNLHNDVEMVSVSNQLRNYANVSLHYSQQPFKIGKESLMKIESKALIESLVNTIHAIYPPKALSVLERLKGRDPSKPYDHHMLIVTHKMVEEKFMDQLQARLNNQAGNQVKVTMAHWGDLTGKNDYKDCDSILFLGVPQKPAHHITNLHLTSNRAVSAVVQSNDECLTTELTNERLAIEYGDMTAEITQAINRIQCRKVIDAQGNCPITNIYFYAPIHINFEQNLLPKIKQAMPNIVAAPTQILTLPTGNNESDTLPRGVKKRQDMDNKFMNYISLKPDGEYKTADIISELAIARTVMTRITKAIDAVNSGAMDEADPLHKFIQENKLKVTGGNRNRSIVKG